MPCVCSRCVPTVVPLGLRQVRYLHYRPGFDGSLSCARNPCSDADRLLEGFGVDQEIAAELLVRLPERAVRYEWFSVAYADAGRRRYRVPRVGGHIPAARA